MDDWRTVWINEAGPAAAQTLAAWPTQLVGLAESPQAVADLRRLISAAGALEVAQRCAERPGILRALVQIGLVSRWALDVLLRRPELLWDVVEHGRHREVWGRMALGLDLGAALDAAPPADDEAFAVVLMRWKERHYLRLILGDVAGTLGFEAIVAELSDLTDVIVEAALLRARAAVARTWPLAAFTFVVLGMGKLGGRELNYSSDIDLIFIYEDQHPELDTSCHECCQKLGSILIRLLDSPSKAGRLFRVDMRLRPEGDRGELALSLRETIDYYYSAGRPWERQALIKARPMAGDADLGRRFASELTPWIYPIEPDWQELDGTRAMRRRIEERKAVANLKTGAGGIRDIEFLVQFFQLSHGGRLPELHGRATLPMLRALADVALLPRAHADELAGHYIFLRTAEHRLQMWEDRQLHDLPADPGERTSLARRCGFSGADLLTQFEARLQRVRDRVRFLADQHYLRATVHEDAVLALLAQDGADDDLIATVLGNSPLRDRRQAAALLRTMAREPFFLLSRSRTERELAALVPKILEQLATSPDPDQALANLARITAAVGGRATFFALLAGSPQALKVVCDLAGWANYLVNLLGEVPGLPDEVVDTLNQAARRGRLLQLEARNLVTGLSDMVPTLRFFQARECVAVAVRDLEGQSQAEVQRHLSDLAIAILTVTWARLTGERVREWGAPVADHRQTRCVLLGLGKLGSRALSYASDIDIIVICDPAGICRRNQRSGEEFWHKVAQDLLRTLGDGRIYEIDPRLRPWGDQGPLVTPLPMLVQYWAEPRDLWERMAMLRISQLAGDPTLGDEAIALIRRAALMTPLPTDAAAQVHDMRRRLEASVAGRDHVKRGWGGYVDHEFIAHYRSFGLDPAVIPPGATIEATLEQLTALGRIPTDALPELIRGLHWLRFVESRSRLAAGKAISSIPTDPTERLALARRCGKDDLASFDLEMHDARQNARRWFEALIV